MRILIISARYLPHIGGLEHVVQELSAHLREEHEIQIVTNRQPRTLPEHEIIDGIPVTRLFFLFPRWRYLKDEALAFIYGVLISPITLFRLWRLITTFKPDVVNMHYAGNQTVFVWLLHRLLKFRLVVSVHGSDVWHEAARSAFDYWMFRTLARDADALTACSQTLLDVALEVSPTAKHKSIAIYNGVDYDLFAYATPYQHPRPYVFAVGRLDRRKGFHHLIEAFSQLGAAGEGFDLLIAGGGGEHAALDALIDKFGLRGRAHLLGRKSSAEVASLMHGSAAIAIPSLQEAFGIVAVEAMASGRPLVVARVDGLKEAAQHAQVTWVDMGDIDDLRRGLVAALAESAAVQAANSAHNQAMCRDLSWERVTERYADVLEKSVSA